MNSCDFGAGLGVGGGVCSVGDDAIGNVGGGGRIDKGIGDNSCGALNGS